MAIREYYSTREVADMFCVSVPTVRSWRTPAYEDSPLRLVGERTAHNRYRYSLDALDEFVERNPRFNPFLAATLKRGTPVFPKDIALAQAAALRNTRPAADAAEWWASLHTIEQTPQLETHKENPL